MLGGGGRHSREVGGHGSLHTAAAALGRHRRVEQDHVLRALAAEHGLVQGAGWGPHLDVEATMLGHADVGRGLCVHSLVVAPRPRARPQQRLGKARPRDLRGSEAGILV